RFSETPPHQSAAGARILVPGLLPSRPPFSLPPWPPARRPQRHRRRCPPTIPADDPTVITDWNALAVTTLTGDATKPAVEAILYMAFVHAAVYDAVVGIDGRYAPYRFHAHAPHRHP